MMADTYYVRDDGNNANDGSADDADHAWATLAYAVADAQTSDGDTVMIRGGSYTEVADIVISGKSLTITPHNGIAILDCSALPGANYVLALINSATVINGDVSNYLQIGIDGAAGSGGSQHSVYVRGCVDATNYVKVCYLRVYATAGDGKSAFVVDTDTDSADGRALFDHCLAKDVAASDGFSANGLVGETHTVYMDCVSCVADSCGQDGFTSHYKSVVTTQFCTAQNCDTGFTPAFGSTWTSTGDTLMGNNKTARKSNLYIIQGADFTATNLTLGGTTTNHIYVSKALAEEARVATITGMTVTGTAARWIVVDGAGSTGTQALTIRRSTLGGTVTDHAMDDNDADADTLVTVRMESCKLTMNASAKSLLASRATRGVLWRFYNCNLINEHATGRALYLADAAGDVQLKNCIISAGDDAILDASGGGDAYTTGCGYNILDGDLVTAVAQTGDVEAAAEIDTNDQPIDDGNCDDTGDPSIWGTTDLDFNGNPRLLESAVCIGAVERAEFGNEAYVFCNDLTFANLEVNLGNAQITMAAGVKMDGTGATSMNGFNAKINSGTVKDCLIADGPVDVGPGVILDGTNTGIRLRKCLGGSLHEDVAA